MATLVVRPLATRDIPALRHVAQRKECVAHDRVTGPRLPGVVRSVLSASPTNLSAERVYVALVDEELCAYARLRPHTHEYHWDVTCLAAGSPHLDADDDVTTELWSALLEYAISSAGAAGAKRLFATANDGTASMRSLRLAGFEPYSRYTILQRTGLPSQTECDCHVRPQEASDVWSIHHLYHQTTPRVVQFAEALTSAAWEFPTTRWYARIVPRKHDVTAYVLETTDGIEGYCRAEHVSGQLRVSVFMNPRARLHIMHLVSRTIASSGAGESVHVEVAIPEYQRELTWFLEDSGFVPLGERTALVRHTTAPAAIYGRFAPLTPDVAEGTPRSMPSFCHTECGYIAASDGYSRFSNR